MTSDSAHRHSLLTESWVFAGRLFIQWRRYPMVPLQALLFPTLLLIIYGALVGKSMVRLTGNSGLDVLIPVCTLAGAMSGAIGAGLVVPYDRDSGLLTRLWIMPVHRTAPLTGALLAEAVRTFAGSAVVVATGYVMGFRFSGGWLGLIVYLLVPVIVVVVFATIVITLALRPQGRVILTWTQTLCTGLAFATIIPLDRLPAVLRPLAQYQPVAPAAAAMRALSSGGNVWQPMLFTVLWAVVIGALFVPATVRGYKAAVEGGKVNG
ncbi:MULTISPECIES: ABC transporter permease [Mycobacteriaceae]|jgi:ABC-2 type transport system permease protein|uniref:ABC-2 type transport system permease protein n=1 Tax=Mycolicibacterium fluoranthenivorans TaxID=258505 RepID=A0A1G4WCK8_9MYCO|nr:MULTISPECIES: ABC transporter permease [Mycobacteriaceae]MCV7256498.1 ABC transporter permease [Mycobacterium hackensackense]SCX20416.1 ABC-2 type transport system permease protein [Mycolicibacterium fluoranthenivorans]